MIIYTVTVEIQAAVVDEWLAWMRDVHIPEVLNTDCFTESRVSKMFDSGVDPVYIIRYVSEEKELTDRYFKEFAPELQRKHTEKYAGKFTASRTLAEEILILKEKTGK